MVSGIGIAHFTKGNDKKSDESLVELNEVGEKIWKWHKRQLTKAREEAVEGFIQWLMEDNEYTLRMYRYPYETLSICAEEYKKSLEDKK